MLRLQILCGPTASGKSQVALHLAEKRRGEILSIDSMKIYKRLDIGTAKPSREDRARVPHHLIDIREPWESFSVAAFVKAAEALIADAAARHVPLIGEGGTALYLKSLSEGLFEGPGADAALREKLEAEAAGQGVAALYERLKGIDPQAAGKILAGDRRRIIRALEVHALTGKPISAWQKQWGVARSDMALELVCLNLPRKTLYARIDARVKQMIARGWVDECRELLKLPRPLSKEASQALGYRTLFSHLRGEMSLEAAIERICFDTHHFARRQLNWYRHLPGVRWVEIDGSQSVEEVAGRVEVSCRQDAKDAKNG